MKTAIRVIVTILLVAAVTSAIIGYNRSENQPAAGRPLTIHFTCDSSGRLEPCGCFTGQHGGLTRLRTWLESRKETGSVLNLDVGGAISGNSDYDLVQYKYLARAYHSMGFSVLNMGGREAMLPADTLASLAEESPVPLISASLVDALTRKAVLEPYRIVELDGFRVGILGVVSPHSVPNPGAGLMVLGLNEAVDRQLPALAKKTDLIILLAFADESEMRRLARDYFEFSLILGGDVPGPTQNIIRENDSMILFTTNQARTVGTLTARPGGDQRTRLLDPRYEIQLLWDNIPQHEKLRAMVREYRSEIRRTPLAIDDPNAVDPDAIPGVAVTARYVGSASCVKCHPQAYEVWEKSGHAHAFETLVKTDSDADPHCISCHTTGFGRPSGYRRPLGSESLVDVSCESCHGPASEHLARYQDGKPTSFKFRPLGAGDCMSCHYGEFSRPFDWDTFWPGIDHGKESTPPK